MKTLIRIPYYFLAALLVLCAMLVFFGVGDKPEIPMAGRLPMTTSLEQKKSFMKAPKPNPTKLPRLH